MKTQEIKADSIIYQPNIITVEDINRTFNGCWQSI